jgi:hypothetical protein
MFRIPLIWISMLSNAIFMTKPDFLPITPVSDLDEGRLPTVSIDAIMAFRYSVCYFIYLFNFVVWGES